MTGVADSPRLVPRQTLPRDRALPLIIGGSLLLHALVLLPFLKRDRIETMPTEVPVELVQLPGKAPETAIPKPAKTPPATPAKPPEKTIPKPPAKAAAKPLPKPPPRSPSERPRRTAKPPAPRPAPKPAPQPLLHLVPPPAQPPRPGMSVADRLESMLGPMSAFALPGASADGSDDVGYSQLVLSQVAKAKKQGRYRGIPGRAGVAFSIGDNGEIVSLELVAPSGDPSLDEEAVAMIKRAAPYPPPPPGGRRDYAITLRFSAL